MYQSGAYCCHEFIKAKRDQYIDDLIHGRMVVARTSEGPSRSGSSYSRKTTSPSAPSTRAPLPKKQLDFSLLDWHILSNLLSLDNYKGAKHYAD